VEEPITRDDLGRVSELFLSGTTTEVFPITTVDGLQVGTGKTGEITRALQVAFAQEVANLIA
jgi:branched-subunit amino acid aminotransferase/4-amino-4-deoxychorismate lyase